MILGAVREEIVIVLNIRRLYVGILTQVQSGKCGKHLGDKLACNFHYLC